MFSCAKCTQEHYVPSGKRHDLLTSTSQIQFYGHKIGLETRDRSENKNLETIVA